MKVFISYSRKDAEFVNKLKEALEASDISVIIDVESLEFGDNLQAFLEQSVRETDLTIAVISKHSLQSVWVIAEALETLMYEHVEGRKRFLPIYIDTSFLDDTLYLEIVDRIDASITTLQELTNQAIEKHLGTAHLDQKRERFITLRNNLDNILKKLADVRVADFSSEEKFAENLPKLIDVIKQAEKEREQYTGRPLTYLAPFQAPPLPQHFVPRPEVTDVLKARLLNNEPTTPGILVVSAIFGLGGIGKSTLAAALTYDKEIQERFPDGILWATLGQQPEILSLISGWIHAMRDYDFRPTTIEAASAHLRTLLQDKAVLLVVDDVWNPEHAIHFKVGGPRCQVLITTRRADVADEVGAELYQMDVMTPEQSLDLLAARLHRPLETTEREEASSLAEAVGYLPLALELAAVRVARGTSWRELLQALEQEIAHLEKLEDSPRRRRKKATKLEASFNLSLNALRTGDEEAWQAFIWLGVLPEDVQIAAPMAATLWNVEQAEASELLELLWNDALLLPGSPILVGDKEYLAYRLHDLLHDIACKLLTTERPQGLALPLPETHATLLEHYKQHTQNGLWHTLPADGYIHSHLTLHLQQARQEEQIHALLREETAEGQNGWYQAREQLGQTSGFLADVNLAWKLAEKENAIGLQCHYGLIIVSLNSLAKNIPPTLMVALVEKRVWNPVQGLAYAFQIPDSAQRTKTLLGLILHLPESLREYALREALAVAQAIEDTGPRAEALAEVASYLSESLREYSLRKALMAAHAVKNTKFRIVLLTRLIPHLSGLLKENALREALAAAQTIEDMDVRAEMLMEVAPHLSGLKQKQTLGKAVATAQAIEYEQRRTEALIGLIPRLAELGYPKEALAAIKEIRGKRGQTKALLKLVSHLPKSFLWEVVAASQTIWDKDNRISLLASLAPHLPKELLSETLVGAKTIRNENIRAKTLIKLIPQLVESGHAEEVLGVIQMIRNNWQRAETLVTLAPYLAESKQEQTLQEALAAAKRIDNLGDRAMTLMKLAPHLPEPKQKQTLREALAAAQAVKNVKYRVDLLTRLVPHLSEAKKEQVLRGALAAVQSIENKTDRIQTLARLAPYLPESLLREALAVAQVIRDEDEQAMILVRMAPYLPESLLREALAAAQVISDEDELAMILMRMAPYLPESLLREMLVVTQIIKSKVVQAQVLSGLALHLPEPLRANTLQKAFMIAQAINWTNEEARAKAFASIVPYLPESLVREALAVEQREIKVYTKDNRVLVELASRLAEVGSPKEALMAVQAIESKEVRAEALAGIAPYLPEPLLREALATAQAIESAWSRARALSGLVPRLAEVGAPEEALVIAQAIGVEEIRANVLADLIPYLPELLLQEVWSAVLAIEDMRYRAKALVGVAPHLLKSLRENMSQEVLATTQAMEYTKGRAKVLAGLAPLLVEFPFATLLPLWQELFENLARRTRQDLLADLNALSPVIAKLGGEEAIVEFFHAIKDVGRWWP